MKTITGSISYSSRAQIDNTLTISGMAADSKVTGDSIAEALDEATRHTDAHANNKGNPHNVTAYQVGLGEVDNTSDMNKPVSHKQAEAIADAKSAGISAQSTVNFLASIVATKDEVLNKTGDSMRGNLDMLGHHILGLPTPTEDDDIITKSYMETYITNTFLGGEW